MYPCPTITRKFVKTIEPPCTERYARWCGRSAAQLMSSLLPDKADRSGTDFSLLVTDTDIIARLVVKVCIIVRDCIIDPGRIDFLR